MWVFKTLLYTYIHENDLFVFFKLQFLADRKHMDTHMLDLGWAIKKKILISFKWLFL